eukprot:CAMPEP_0204610442 /NCGR_PEP_ID=MMETSP0661-20131031/61506_1 /ASSEMBLY_ACC=CAM_ASM_000606 /TAXON_ID=109239 /ORGANISM="Alexandrium margalefi, Strain AMGDE01CS-322" /LENGTH=199 /DNA_ID=CAMNT_0051622253 /DNA_START=521 /DNA_END=1120 /DNA_ORIENTATION=+
MIPAGGRSPPQPTRAGRELGPSLEELCEPLEAFGVAHTLNDTDHEELHRPDTRVVLLGLLTVSHMAVEPKHVTKLVLGRSRGDVDLVAQHDEGHICEGLVLKQVRQLLLGLRKACTVCSIHEENDAVDIGKVVLPDAVRRLVATEVVGAEADVLDHQLFCVRVQCWHVRCHAVILEHVKQRGLTRIVKAQEENLRVLVS